MKVFFSLKELSKIDVDVGFVFLIHLFYKSFDACGASWLMQRVSQLKIDCVVRATSRKTSDDENFRIVGYVWLCHDCKIDVLIRMWCIACRTDFQVLLELFFKLFE